MSRLLPLLLTCAVASALEVSEDQFTRADRNGDGVVTRAELTMPQLFKALDRDGDGRISRVEAGLDPDGPRGEVRIPPRRLPRSEAALLGQRLDLGEAAPLLHGRPALAIVLRDPTCPVGAKLRGDLLAAERLLDDLGIPLLRIGIADDSSTLAGDDVGFTGRRLDDDDQTWSRLLRAERSTEVFLIDAASTLRYRGALNDRVGLGYELAAAREDYLLAAARAVVAQEDVAIPATAAPGCALAVPATTAPPGAPTWHGDIARIIQDRCLSCHHADGVGPFPLETHGQVSGRRRAMIREVVLDRRMPPWFADPAHGSWTNDASLTAIERERVVAWIDAGCPEGDPAQGPVPRTHDGTWAIGEPDLVLDLGADQQIPASGTIPYRHVEITNPLKEDVWIQAYEIRPTAPQVVHHVLVFLDDGLKRSAGGVRGFFAGAVPGQNAVTWAPGLAKRLPAGCTLVFQLHYTTNGHAATDRTRIGFRFASTPPDREIFTRSVATTRFQIPPGAANHVITAEQAFTRDTVLLAFMPHMHVRGTAYRYELVRPDGSTEILLDIPHYDFNWQLRYEASTPILVPAGSRLRGTAHYDNSAGNPANPDPTATVRHGEQTWDEMMIGYIEGYE